jgi:hypothetical protein
MLRAPDFSASQGQVSHRCAEEELHTRSGMQRDSLDFLCDAHMI